VPVAAAPVITTIVPAKDEELHIVRCVASALPLGEVVVVDGGSADDTVALARANGATVLEREWSGYASQKNWALEAVGNDPDWILFLDADEYLTEAGRATVRSTIASGRADGYYVARRYFFLGRRLDHAYWYPDYQLRLFRAGRARFEDRRVHEHMVVDGRVAEAEIDLMHENLKGISDYVGKLNRYADLEAQEILWPSPGRKPGTFLGGWPERRRALKELWPRVRGRALVRFLWLYVVRRGFLDGRAGLIFCGLTAIHEFLIEAKVAEHRSGFAPEQVRHRVLGSSSSSSSPPADADATPSATSRIASR
jgi:glycosyltransferase involved in cell wall biosynthesis